MIFNQLKLGIQCKNYSPITMTTAAIMLFMRTICFRTWKSNVTIRTITIDLMCRQWLLCQCNLCLLGLLKRNERKKKEKKSVESNAKRRKIKCFYLTRTIVTIRRNRTWCWRCLMHSHVSIQWDFLISAVRTLCASIQFLDAIIFRSSVWIDVIIGSNFRWTTRVIPFFFTVKYNTKSVVEVQK